MCLQNRRSPIVFVPVIRISYATSDNPFAKNGAVRRRFSGPLDRRLHCNALHLISVKTLEICSDFQSCGHWPANGQRMFVDFVLIS
jgi:hypothetical protein